MEDSISDLTGLGLPLFFSDAYGTSQFAWRLAMSRLPRIVSYAGMSLALVLLMYSCSVEHGRVQDHVADASVARMIFLGAGSAVMGILLGILAGCDVRQFAGAEKFDLTAVATEESQATAAATLEEVEKTRKTDPLEAVRVLREYLTQNPGATLVMTRIAEIYEKDLRNPLAAALEYEELLKQKFDPERWGRTAIHLTNLYIRLHEQEKAIAILHRIVQECGNTPAAEKARKRLAQIG
jgi:signal transduction histidine kinase